MIEHHFLTFLFLVYLLGVVMIFVIAFIANNWFDQDSDTETVIKLSVCSWIGVVVVMSVIVEEWFNDIKDKPFGKIPKKTPDDDKDWHLKRVKDYEK